MDGELHTRWTERELLDVAELISSRYPSYYAAQFCLFVLGERPSVGLPMCVDGSEHVVGELGQRFPYRSYDPDVLADTIFCRGRLEAEAAQRLVEEGPRMTAEEVHRTAGRAYGYPSDAVEFFIQRFDAVYPTAADARITLNDLLREGEISPREQKCTKLIPYVYSGDRMTVRQCVETAVRWDAALPNGVTY